MKRWRPGRLWPALEISLLAPFALLLVTVAWFNDRHSLGRWGLLIGAWSIAGYIVWQAVRGRRRRQ